MNIAHPFGQAGAIGAAGADSPLKSAVVLNKSQLRLEPWLVGAIAAQVAWLAALSFPSETALWTFVLCAVGLVMWSLVGPARSQFELAARGAALVAFACLVYAQTAPTLGGAAGLFPLWLSIAAVYYACLLSVGWAAGVLLVGAAAMALCALNGVGTLPADLLSQAAVLCVFLGLMSIRLNGVGRRLADANCKRRIDTSTGLFNLAGLMAYGSEMLEEELRQRRTLSVAVFNFDDLLEVKSIYGSDISRKLVVRVVAKLQALAGGRGLAARTGVAQFTVVLPGLGREQALLAIQRVLGKPTRIEFDAGDSEIVLVPDFVVDVGGADTDSMGDLYRELCRDLVKMQHVEQRRQHYLQRERERHSRPIGLPAALSDRPAATSKAVPAPTQPRTLEMPLR